MRSLKIIAYISTFCVILSGCGGGSETPVSFNPPPPVVSESEYERQTKAAREQFEARLSAALAESESWMEANRREDGVITTQSGLQYRIDVASSNPDGQRYESDEIVTVHYEGRLIDGTIFNSTYDRGRPDRLKPSELIEGWQEALSLMQPGDQWTVFIPSGLGYGALGKGGSVPPHAALIFRVELR